MKTPIDCINSAGIRAEMARDSYPFAYLACAKQHPTKPGPDWTIRLYRAADRWVLDTNADPIWEGTPDFEPTLREYGIHTLWAVEAALWGDESPAVLYWDTQVPGDPAPAYRVGDESGRLYFDGWAATDGRDVRGEVDGYNLGDYFDGPNGAYRGPDRDGIYPLLAPE